MALQDVADALRGNSIKIDFEQIQDADTKRAIEQIERLLRRMINDIVRNTPVVSPADYTLDPVVAIDRTLLASAAPSTIINNNNVLAALITDLTALGLIT